jgi:hypothetical protein
MPKIATSNDVLLGARTFVSAYVSGTSENNCFANKYAICAFIVDGHASSVNTDAAMIIEDSNRRYISLSDVDNADIYYGDSNPLHLVTSFTSCYNNYTINCFKQVWTHITKYRYVVYPTNVSNGAYTFDPSNGAFTFTDRTSFSLGYDSTKSALNFDDNFQMNLFPSAFIGNHRLANVNLTEENTKLLTAWGECVAMLFNKSDANNNLARGKVYFIRAKCDTIPINLQFYKLSRAISTMLSSIEQNGSFVDRYIPRDKLSRDC